MLRNLVVIVGATLLGVGMLALVLVGGAGGFVPAGLGVLLLAAGLIEHHLYHRPASTAPGPGWQRTGERFRDPSSGQIIDAWVNQDTGQRSYVRAHSNAQRRERPRYYVPRYHAAAHFPIA